jgi:phosphate transport system protein
MSLRLASAYSSAFVFGVEPPLRLRAATAAPCLPRAVRVLAGMLAIERLRPAPACALRTFRFAAATCLRVAMRRSFPAVSRDSPGFAANRLAGPALRGYTTCVATALRVQFRNELAEIDGKVVRLFALVCETIAAANEALMDADGDAAGRIAERAVLVDDLELELQEVTEHLLLTQAPMNSDMRYLVTVLRIVPQLERCGDLAEHIAERGQTGLGGRLPPRVRGLFEEMGVCCMELWREARRAWAEGDEAVAAALDAADDRLDDLHDELISALVEADTSRQDLMQATLVARFYERLGDHAVHLADRIRYVTSGHRRSHETGA